MTIRAIVFDLDGTLYVSPPFASAIQDAAVHYIAGLWGIGHEDAGRMMADTRSRLSLEMDREPTLSAVCVELGGTIRDLHTFFESRLSPESFLIRDQRVISLLDRLAEYCDIFLYTNNNRPLTARILGYLGIEGKFRQICTIDDNWRAKPDEETIRLLLGQAGVEPAEALFVGDRYDVDLRLPEQLGCPVYLSQSIDQLLRLEELVIHN